jgi:hypothetical protein
VKATGDQDWFGGIAVTSDEPNGYSWYSINLDQVAGTLILSNRTVDSAGDNDWYKFEMLGTGQAGDKVRIDFSRVVVYRALGQAGEPGAVDYRRLDLAVFQDLPFSPFASARWRVLMAYHGLLFDSIDGSQPLPGSSATSRVTGGVDISF